MRGERRFQERKVQEKRLRKSRYWRVDLEKFERKYGQLKHNHLGCSCPMCKPHKYGFDYDLKPSDRRRLDGMDQED